MDIIKVIIMNYKYKDSYSFYEILGGMFYIISFIIAHFIFQFPSYKILDDKPIQTIGIVELFFFNSKDYVQYFYHTYHLTLVLTYVIIFCFIYFIS